MSTVGKPTDIRHLQPFRQNQSVSLSGVDLPEIESGLVGIGQIAPILRNRCGVDGIIYRICGDARDSHRSRSMGCEKESQGKSHQYKNDRADSRDDPPPPDTRRTDLWREFG